MRALPCLIAAIVPILALSGAAQAASPAKPVAYHAPRTSYGTPDLQGLWTNTALTFLQRTPMFKALIATDKEEAMMVSMFKKMAGSIASPDPIDPKLPAPPVVKEAPQADF